MPGVKVPPDVTPRRRRHVNPAIKVAIPGKLKNPVTSMTVGRTIDDRGDLKHA